MNPLGPMAESMFRARSFAESVDHLHRSDYAGLPATVMARAHAMRSALQAELIGGDVPGFTLVDSYLGFGRVEVIRDDTRQHYLLKARGALPFEVSVQQSLFGDVASPPGSRPLLLLLYEFLREDSLHLMTAPVEKVKLNGRIRYRLLEGLRDAGVWPADDIPGIEPFDQGADDDFGDLSEGVRLIGEGGEGRE